MWLGTRDVSAWSLYASSGQIGFTVNGGTTTKLDDFGGGDIPAGPTATPTNTPTPTPSSSLNCASELLDNFNRADGGLGANWQGHLGQYSIVSNQVGTNNPCCEVTWVNGFGASQDACLTLSVMDTTASEVGVVLKVQNGFTYWGGLKVVYVPSTGVQVWTREPTDSWVQQGSTLAATFASGDVLGARAKSNGTVEVYKNGSLVGTRDVSSWSLYASAGQIGFTVNGGTTTKLDNFGGGDIPAGPTATPTNTPTPTPSSSLNCASELLDNFNRADGGLGANWQGHLGQYSIVSNQVGTNNPCCEVTWVNGFGASQDACLTLSVMDTTASEVGVVLKVQNGFTYWGGLKVVYVPGTGVQVWTREPTEGWVQQGSTLAATFASGDVLGARAKSNGTVEVYKNGSLVGSRDVSAWSLYASSGQIGFTVNGGTTTKLDNFGGGTYTGLLPSQTDSAFRTVAYSSPRASEANTPAIVVTPPANQTWRNYYYLGGKRIALRVRVYGQADVVNYLHGDHLGSASLATSSSGAVVSSARYYPFGADRSGSMPTDYKFTGQRQEANIGLYDYGARFYDPLLGRFVSADSIVPGAGNPQSLNRFSYVLNNPLRYIDDDGHLPVPIIIAGVVFAGIALGTAIHELISPPEQQLNPLTVQPITAPRVDKPTSSDMTQWLVEHMRTTAQAPITQAFREHFSSPWPQDQLGALKAWVAMVRSEGVWDFKGDIAGARLSTFPNVTLGGQQLNYQAVANIFFGFEGRATGQVGWWLEASAGAFQVVRWIGQDRSNIGPIATFFDDPFDNWSIGFGIFLYDLYGQNLDALTPEALSAALQQYIEQYGAPPPPLNP